MKHTIACTVAAGIALIVCGCTTVKQDDHSYMYVYSHQAAPPARMLETVTTNSTRTRRFEVQEEAELAADRIPNSSADISAIESLRSDPIPSEKRSVH
jgi:hypothetical protein